MRIFRNKPFGRFARRVGLADAVLCKTISNIEKGLIDADLGGGVIKQRLARPGGAQARRAGFFFVHGFAKNERANIEEDELKALKKLSHGLLGLDEAQLAAALRAGVLTEVKCGEGEEAISKRPPGVGS